MTHQLLCPRPAIIDSPPRGDAADVVVDVRGVSKKFCRDLRRSLWYGARDMLAELARRRSDRRGLRTGEFWAARDVSFQLARGEAIALVGRNGAGKTTLLRIIAGLIRPDTGEVRTRGRLAPLLALGAGFNPVLTGRENIYVNMSVLGLSTRQIRQRFDEVVAFAEIDTAIDAPVRTYSSGMTARLGFACAVHVAPEVFIIDEALAVGDATFRGKCFRKLAELRRQGVSLLVVSHNVQVLLAVCDRAVYLQQGEIVTAGPTADVLTRYTEECEEAIHGALSVSASYCSKPPRSAGESSGLDILEVRLTAHGGEPSAWHTARPATIRVRCRCYRPIRNANLFVGVKRLRAESEFVLALNSRDEGQLVNLPPGDHEIGLFLPSCGLPRGTYNMKLRIEESQLSLLDMIDWDRLRFRVEADPLMQDCAYYQPREWITSPAIRPERLAS